MSATTFEDFGIKVDGTGEQSTTCPQCSPGRKKKNLKCLSVNVEKGTWHCHHCGWSEGLPRGGDGYHPPKSKPKPLTRPDFKFTPDLQEEAYIFLVEKRKIPPTVLQRNRVCSQGGAILFPFYKNGECVNVKYRGPDKKFWQSKAGEKVLYGFDDIDDAQTIITEGELDKLALEVAGYKNAVSVPDGAPSPEAKAYASKFNFLDNCRDRIAQVKHFILAVDNDPPGKKLETELARRLGPERCSRVEWPPGCKDANDVLVQHGPDKLAGIIEAAIPFPVEGLYHPRDVDLDGLYDRGLEPGCSPGWISVEKLYTVCKESGELTIVTGIPGHGKSEWLDALLVNLAESEGWNFGVCSPENFPLEYHLSKLAEKFFQAPFREGFKNRISKGALPGIQNWLDEHFTFLMPNEDDLTVDEILRLARVLVYRRGIKGLILDPWGEIDHSRPDNISETEYISQSLTKIRRFARNHGCHVWLVAHPFKLQKINDGTYPVPTPYDISGSAHWRNKADNCIAVWRDTSPGDSIFEVEIHIQKIRKKHIGRLGMAKLRYEYSTGRYHEL